MQLGKKSYPMGGVVARSLLKRGWSDSMAVATVIAKQRAWNRRYNEGIVGER